MTHTMPTESSSDGSIPVLTVTDWRGDRARIGFGTDGIGIDTARLDEGFAGVITRLEGTDLTALRDLLLAMPAEAFPSRAESYLLVDGDGFAWIYAEHTERWCCVFDAEEWERDLLDEVDVDDLMARQTGIFKGFDEAAHRLIDQYGLKGMGETYCLLDLDGDWWVSDSDSEKLSPAYGDGTISVCVYDLDYIEGGYGIDDGTTAESLTAAILRHHGVEAAPRDFLVAELMAAATR